MIVVSFGAIFAAAEATDVEVIDTLSASNCCRPVRSANAGTGDQASVRDQIVVVERYRIWTERVGYFH